MTTKDLKYDINIADRAERKSERTDVNLESSSIIGKMLSNRITCYREIFHEKKNQPMWGIFLSHFKKSPLPSEPSATTTLTSQ